jgi:hypothetical protein
MKVQVKQPEKVSHVIQGKTKASRQTPLEQILQRYSGESGKVKVCNNKKTLFHLSIFTFHLSPFTFHL